MATFQPSRARPSPWQRGRQQLRRLVPVAIWLGAVGWLLVQGGPSPWRDLRGLVAAPQAEATTPTAGRLQVLLCALHDPVAAGEVLARLDDTDVRLRLRQAGFELEKLRADLDRESAELARETATTAAQHGLETGVEQRRLVSTLETAQLAALAVRTQLEEARVRVQGAAIDAGRLEALASQAMVGDAEVVRARTERDALQKRVAELSALLQEHQQRVQTAEQRVRDFAPGTPLQLPVAAALAPLRWRLKAQEAALERLAEDARDLDLRAPLAGRVVALGATPGEWLPAGRTVVTIGAPTAGLIHAYVAEALRHELATGQPVAVHRSSGECLGTTRIRSISPQAVRLPERLWRDPQRPEWGFELLLPATGPEQPGELVRLALQR